MTWQGGKKPPQAGPLSFFARLKPLAGATVDPAKGLEKLAQSLGNYESPVCLHFRFVTGKDRESVEHWEIRGGGSKKGKAERKKPKDADVIVVMRPETWTQIAQGRLAPYEALYTGKLRVGGNFEMAKAITRHLSDPAQPYVAPC